MEKIFGVGWPKTGTTTLERACQLLGYNVCRGHYQNNHTHYLVALSLLGDTNELLRFTRLFDAFFDGPWGGTDLYQSLHTAYPEAKYLLSVRDPEKWYVSLEKMCLQFAESPETALEDLDRHTMYGLSYFLRKRFDIDSLAGNRQKIIDIYAQHNEAVESYLKERGADLLIADFTAGAEWEELCSWLGKPVPDKRFPHMNPAPEPKQKTA